MVARLIAYVFLGSFCIAGPLCLFAALGSTLQRAALIYSGLRAEGTVIAKKQMGSTRATYAPVFQFVASDGRTYVVSSDVYGKESAFKYGDHVRVLYRHDHPESARIDAFAPLWTFPLVFGVVGAAFSVIPAIVLASWMRRRRTCPPSRRPRCCSVRFDFARRVACLFHLLGRSSSCLWRASWAVGRDGQSPFPRAGRCSGNFNGCPLRVGGDLRAGGGLQRWRQHWRRGSDIGRFGHPRADRLRHRIDSFCGRVAVGVEAGPPTPRLRLWLAANNQFAAMPPLMAAHLHPAP